MITRIWRGWAAASSADVIAADLRAGPLARFAAAPGNISAEVLVRPFAGGVEVLTLSVWESSVDVPASVEEGHRLLVARQTIADTWEMVAAPAAVAHAA